MCLCSLSDVWRRSGESLIKWIATVKDQPKKARIYFWSAKWLHRSVLPQCTQSTTQSDSLCNSAEPFANSTGDTQWHNAHDKLLAFLFYFAREHFAQRQSQNSQSEFAGIREFFIYFRRMWFVCVCAPKYGVFPSRALCSRNKNIWHP